ncbi:ribonuclease III [Guyanagaster necrorhizus]|uniref:Ribonuclease III n=1 Tax=Guyanagaster necrorhizus TaxID=856835 RepID=A0A9P8AVI4_9AGAR|nr:ribonuclease III [Guyanagaster necrorhizus MCA 3950]KAG7449599.1 ribonuclease III [Guyanagaster necrorhizus MCA 3950]
MQKTILDEVAYLDSSKRVLAQHLEASRRVVEELGPCASDLVWRRALGDIETSLSTWDEHDDDDAAPEIALKVSVRDIVKNWTFAMPNLDIGSRGFNVTPKFLRLVQILKACDPLDMRFRGLVFVSSKAIAWGIIDLLKATGEFRCQSLYGDEAPAVQRDLFHSFKNGTCNLIIAVQSTEDLDIPKASIVIRFSLSRDYLSHAYSYSRAPSFDSHLVFMAERENNVHRHVLSSLARTDKSVLSWVTQTSETSFPPLTLSDMMAVLSLDEGIDAEDINQPCITDATTGCEIRVQNATAVIYRLGAHLLELKPDRDGGNPRLEYVSAQPFYTCQVHLPGMPGELSCISGPQSTSQAFARRQACFVACARLAEAGLLPHQFFPFPENRRLWKPKDLPPATDAKVAGTRFYPGSAPRFWQSFCYSPTNILYPTVICGDRLQREAQHAPLLFLTYRPLPDIPSIKLFFLGIPIVVPLRRTASLFVNDEQVQLLHAYTIRYFRTILNKPYTCESGKMAYFVAPLQSNFCSPELDPSQPFDLPDISTSLSWDAIKLASGGRWVPLQYGAADVVEPDVQDAAIQGHMEFIRRYEVVKVRRDLTPKSIHPNDNSTTILEFVRSKYESLPDLKDENQCILEVVKIDPWLQYASPSSRPQSTKSDSLYMIPELYAKCTVPLSAIRTGFLLPSIMENINHILLVKELNANIFGFSVAEDLLRMAITAPSVGLVYDYERLELLGDSFLKCVSSLYVFVTEPDRSEGNLHASRRELISNNSLLHQAVRVGLPSFIQTKPFSIKSWCPPNFTRDSNSNTTIGQVQESTTQSAPKQPVATPSQTTSTPSTSTTKGRSRKRKKKTRTWWTGDSNKCLGDKTVADVVESIIGAAYLTGGKDVALRVTKDLGISLPRVEQWSDFGRTAMAPSSKVTAKLKPGTLQAIESALGCKFKRPYLLAQALTHITHQGFQASCYERFEFVGDAVLDFLVVRHIFSRNQGLSPGALTLLKGAMVSNRALAALCVCSNLHQHLLFRSAELALSISNYEKEVKRKQNEEYAAAQKEGRASGQFWFDIDAPKPLSDVVESIMGAMCISDDFLPDGVEAIFMNLVQPFYDKHITLQTLSHHPTKVLLELLQASGCQDFEICKEEDNGSIRCSGKVTLLCLIILVHGIVLASASEANPTSAARLASLWALDALEGDLHFLARTCDCRTEDNAKSHLD